MPLKATHGFSIRFRDMLTNKVEAMMDISFLNLDPLDKGLWYMNMDGGSGVHHGLYTYNQVLD